MAGILQLVGDIDLIQTSKTKQAISKMLDQHDYRVLVDMSKVTYLESSGISVLIAELKKAREHNGDLVLCNLQERVAMMLRLTGFDKLFTISTTTDEGQKQLEAVV